MKTEDQTLNKRQMFCQEGIEECDEEDNADHQQRSMPSRCEYVCRVEWTGYSPSLIDVCITVQDNQSLYLCCGEEAADSDTRLPPERR